MDFHARRVETEHRYTRWGHGDMKKYVDDYWQRLQASGTAAAAAAAATSTKQQRNSLIGNLEFQI
jgi:hypothetical protein